MQLVKTPHETYWCRCYYGTYNMDDDNISNKALERLENFSCPHNGYTILSFSEEIYNHCFPDSHDVFCFYYRAYELDNRVRWSYEHFEFSSIYLLLMDSLCYIRMQKQIENSIFPKWLAKKLYYRDTREGIAKKFKFGSINDLQSVENMPISNEEIKTIIEMTVKKLKLRNEMYAQAEKLVNENENVNVLKDVAKLAYKDISDTRAAFCVNGSDTAFLTWLNYYIFRTGNKDDIIRMTDVFDEKGFGFQKVKYIMNIWRYGKYVNGEEYDMYEWDIKTWRKTEDVYDGMSVTNDDISFSSVFVWFLWVLVAVSAAKTIFK